MPKINLNALEFEYDDTDPDEYACGMARIGPGLGAKATGSTVYLIPPGKKLCPYHWEAGEEEWLLVLSGRPTVREPEGETELGVGDLCFFPPSPEGRAPGPQRLRRGGAGAHVFRRADARRRPSTPTATRSGSGPGTTATG